MSWEPVGETEHDGERLAVFRGPGAGPALVLAHGLEDSWQNWRSFTDELRGDGFEFTPYALDLPWRAGADYGWLHHTTSAALLQRALALVPELATMLVGHSFGANAMLELLAAGNLPSAGVVLLTPHYRPPDERVSWQLFDRELSRFRSVIGEGLRVRLGDRRRALDPDLVDTMVDKALERVSPLGFVVLLRQFIATADLNLTGVTVPTLVVAGATDPALAGPRSAALRRAMPVVTVHTRPDGGHFCHVEQVAAVTARIRRFLATLPLPVAV
jgi:pimeloyl-ACP methyl ester carboxylesterase